MKKRQNWDTTLKIQTEGRDDQIANEYNYPYEPTPYNVLERLASSGLIQKHDVLVDFGSGKGRVDFYMSATCHCQTIGIEYDERIYQQAMDNKKNSSAQLVSFYNQKAEEFQIPSTSTCFYFFNPFSVEILYSVLNHILESYYACPRNIMLFFYYPSDAYIAHLMTHDGFTFYDEIECGDLFEGENQRERIMIFTLD